MIAFQSGKSNEQTRLSGYSWKDSAYFVAASPMFVVRLFDEAGQMIYLEETGDQPTRYRITKVAAGCALPEGAVFVAAVPDQISGRPVPGHYRFYYAIPAPTT